MPTFQIRGSIYPSSVVINTHSWDLAWTEHTGAVPIQFVIVVINSKIQIQCTTESYDPLGNHSLYTTRALELTRAIVDPIAFAAGVGVAVYLEEVITPAGVVKKITPHNVRLQKIAESFGGNVETIQRFIISNPLLYLALNELIVAITLPGQITINCGRALEGLRRIVTNHDENKRQAWVDFQSAINMTREYRDVIWENSTPGRHADRNGLDSLLAQDILERSWTVYMRTVQYMMRGNQPLREPEFVLLK